MTQRFIRRNRVDERRALAIAAVSGIVAAFSGARPTGSVVIDVLILFLAAGTVVWGSASAPWWASAAASGVGALIASTALITSIGAVGFLAGLDIGTWRREQSTMRAVVGGIAVNVLLRSDLGGFHGLSALIGIAVAVALFVLGLLRRPSRIRRYGWLALGATGGLGVLALFAVGVAATSARPDLTTASRSARLGIAAVNAGDYAKAAQLFERASEGFEQASGRLDGTIATPGRLLPGIAQNLDAGAELSAAAVDATANAASALRQVDPSTLQLRNGSVDLGAVRAVEEPLVRVATALGDLRVVVDAIDSPWLFSVVRSELDELEGDLDRYEPQLENAIDAVRLAPQLLGEQGQRRYLVLFTSPAEARGLGGFVGSFATVEIDNGAVRLTEFGRTPELSQPTAGTDCSRCPAEMLAKYGPFGFNTGPNGTVSNVLYSNITMPAHFPDIGETVAELYPQAFGKPLDGLIVVDPYAVQALMQYSGPIEVPALDTVVRPMGAAEFILRDQYLLAEDKGVRVEALDALGRGAITAILSGVLPEPPTIARDLGPLIAERRLLMWTTDPAEQDLFDRLGLLGAIPDLDPVDGGFSVSVSNASANKIDVFLERTVDVRVDESAAGRRLIADVTLHNTAPSAGLPEYVIGNLIDRPQGWSRLWVTFYGPDTLMSSTSDDEIFPLGALPEAGWIGYSNYVDLAPGESRSFQLIFSLPDRVGARSGAPQPTLWSQPLASR